MKFRLIMLLSLQLLLLQQLYAQKLVLKLDGEEVAPKSVYEFYPDKFEVALLGEEKTYTILKGTATLVHKNKKLHTESLGIGHTGFPFRDKQLLPGSRLVVEIGEVGDPETRQTKRTNYTAIIFFKDTLRNKPHPEYNLLVNDAIVYMNEALNPQQVEKISFILSEAYNKPEVIYIYHVRGVRPMKRNSFPDARQAAAGLVEMVKDASVRTGDRMVIEINGKKSGAISVPLKF